MNRRTAIASLGLGLLAASCRSGSGNRMASGRFRAFSLREAEQRLRARRPDTNIATLGGLTRVLGLIHDASARDVIVVGHARSGEIGLELDDLVAALRARLDRHEWPLVSIDRNADTQATGQQVVRFEGVSDNAFAAKILAPDLFLKHAALQMPPADALPFRSFFAMCADAARNGAWTGHVSSKLWFYPREASLFIREDVVAIRELRIGVRTQVVGGAEGARDDTSDAYAATFTEHIAAIADRYPDVGRLSGLFDLVACTRGLESFRSPNLDYWMTDYALPAVEIPDRVPLIRRSESIDTNGGTLTLEVNGGVDMQMLRARLSEGDHTAFRDTVLRSRPAATALSWPVPLGAWRFSGDEHTSSNAAPDPDIGTHLERQLIPPTTNGVETPRGGVTTAVTIDPRAFGGKP